MRRSLKIKVTMTILIIISMIVLPISIYAAYTSIREIISEASSGDITISNSNKDFIIYTYDDATTEENEYSRTVCPTNTDDTDYAISNGRIYCYATKKTDNSYIENYIQLNQLGLSFEFNNTIDVYVRIRLEDSWISTKLYRNGTVRSQVILKDTTAIMDLIDTTDWVYDENSGYIYYKTKISKSDTSTSLEINFDKDYYYEVIKVNAYVESVVVNIAYEIDIVQANRAKTKWNIDLDSILNGGE